MLQFAFSFLDLFIQLFFLNEVRRPVRWKTPHCAGFGGMTDALVGERFYRVKLL